LQVADLFSGFRDRLSPLAVVGALLLVATLVIGVVAGMMGAGAILGMAAGGASQSGGGILAAMGVGMLALLVALALSLVATMAVWFAPGLIVFRNVAPVEAMKSSFAACMRNVVPFLVYGVVYIAAAIVASIPFGLGWIVLLPLLMLTIYVSYRDIYGG
jgi:uncharacterized membrane protein